MIKFLLSEEEKKIAIEEGKRRQRVNEEKKLKGRNGGPEYGRKALNAHILGAAGEMAIASFLGLKEYLFLNKSAGKGSADLPFNIDVKTRSRHFYDLIVQQNEDPTKIYALVTIENKEIFLHGWLSGKECMKDDFWADPANGRPAFFIPKKLLKPIESLKDYLSLSIK